MNFTNFQKFLLFIPLFILSFSSNGQNWTDVSRSDLPLEGTRHITPEAYRSLRLDTVSIFTLLTTAPSEDQTQLSRSRTVIEIPMPDGKMESFRIVKYKMMEQELANKYPGIITCRGISVSNPFKRIRLDWTKRGLRVMIQSKGGSVFIDPILLEDNQHYQSYFKKDLVNTHSFECDFESDKSMQEELPGSGGRSGDCVFRSYRLAVATTAEYSNFFNATGPADSATILAEVVTAVNRVNDVYEADVSVRLILVANTIDIFYYDAISDPYTNGNGSAMLGENQTTCTNIIGSGNYDIGHVFSTGGGGVAQLAVPCNNSSKAKGVTGQSQPINDPFYIDYVAHEMGHQFGANHTQNNSCNRNSSTAMEPGSASTIMGYAGICSPNVQSNSDAYFHGISVQEINNFISGGNGNSCDVPLTFGNSAPIVTNQGGYTIPISTPFLLTANATDPDGDSLSYNWEQWDNEVGSMPPQSTNTVGPMFRSFFADTLPTRFFPRLSDLSTSTDFDWEELPSVTRTMDFRVTVRDYHNVAGCTDEDNLLVTTTASAGPFVINDPGVSVVWQETEIATITWDVANTDAGPVNCSNVDILISYDSGLSFTDTIETNVPNDGSHDITVPSGITTTARIMVKCSDNIFFDISNNDIEVQVGVPGFTFSTGEQTVVNCGENQSDFTLDVNSILGYSNQVNLSISGAPDGSSVSFSSNPIIPGNQLTVTINNLSGSSPGIYNLTLTGTNADDTKNLDLQLQLLDEPKPVSLLDPFDGETDVDLQPILNWAPDGSSTSYDVELADNAGFVNSSFYNGITQDTFLVPAPLLMTSTYFWKVRGVNDCAVGLWSSTFSFDTKACYIYTSTDVPVLISSSGTPTITSSLTIVDNGMITDLNVLDLEGTHTYIGDLTFTLIAPDATEVILLDGACGSQNNFDINLDDQADSANHPCPPTDGLTYQPDSPLSAFNTLNMNGTWKMQIEDNFNLDGGSLNNWSIEVCPSDFCKLMVDQNSGVEIGSLEAAIGCSINGDTILFDESVTNDTIFISNEVLSLSEDIYIIADPADNITIKAIGIDRLFNISPGTNVKISGLNIVGGSLNGGSSILNQGNLILENVNLYKRNASNPAEIPLQNEGQLDILGICNIRN